MQKAADFCGVQKTIDLKVSLPEPHAHEQFFPSRGVASFVLNALLRGIHRILLSPHYPLKGLLDQV